MSEKNAKSAVKTPGYLLKIFRLILSLSSKQKQDFKKSAAFYGNKGQRLGYVVLFDLVNDCIETAQKQVQKLPHDIEEKMSNPLTEIFSEVFFKKFERQKQIKQAELSRLCHYLFPRILESTRYQNESKNRTHELLSMLKDIQFLLDKSLFSECSELIVEAKKSAVVLSLFELHAYLLRIERNILLKVQGSEDKQNLKAKMRNLEAEELDILQKQGRLTCLRAINQESLADIWTRKSKVVDADFLHQIKLFNTGFLSEPDDLGVGGRVYWHNTMANFSRQAHHFPSDAFQFLGVVDLSKTLFHQRKIIELLRDNPEHLKENPFQMLSNLANYILLCNYLNEYDAEIIEYFENYDFKDISELMFIRTVAYPRMGLFLLDKTRFAKGIDWLNENRIWQLVNSHRRELPLPQLQSIFLFGGLFFALKNLWEDAENWFAQNERSPSKVGNQGSLVASVYLLQISRLENGTFNNHNYKEILLRNFQQSLLATQFQLDDFDKAFQKMFADLLEVAGKPRKIQQVAAQHLSELDQSIQTAKKPKAFQIVQAWVEAKAKSLVFEDLAIQRLNNFEVVPKKK